MPDMKIFHVKQPGRGDLPLAISKRGCYFTRSLIDHSDSGPMFAGGASGCALTA